MIYKSVNCNKAIRIHFEHHVENRRWFFHTHTEPNVTNKPFYSMPIGCSEKCNSSFYLHQHMCIYYIFLFLFLNIKNRFFLLYTLKSCLGEWKNYTKIVNGNGCNWSFKCCRSTQWKRKIERNFSIVFSFFHFVCFFFRRFQTDRQTIKCEQTLF